MPKITKNQILWLLLVAVLIVGGVVYVSFQKGGWSSQKGGKETGQTETGGAGLEVLNMAAVVSQIDAERNTLLVKAAEGGKDIKLALSGDTEIIKLELPFDPAHPPTGETTFTPERTPIKIQDLKTGERILVETRTNLYGKTELNDVVRIQVLP